MVAYPYTRSWLQKLITYGRRSLEPNRVTRIQSQFTFRGETGKKVPAEELSECVFLANSDVCAVVFDTSLRDDKG